MVQEIHDVYLALTIDIHSMQSDLRSRSLFARQEIVATVLHTYVVVCIHTIHPPHTRPSTGTGYSVQHYRLLYSAIRNHKIRNGRIHNVPPDGSHGENPVGNLLLRSRDINGMKRGLRSTLGTILH